MREFNTLIRNIEPQPKGDSFSSIKTFRKQNSVLCYYNELTDNSLFDLTDNFTLPNLLDHIKEDCSIEYRGDVFDYHKSLKNSCDHNQFFTLWKCPKNDQKHQEINKKDKPYRWIKRICDSFFCEECHISYTQKIKRHLRGYAMNTNHRFIVFTIPKELRKLIRWDQDTYVKIRKKKGRNDYYDIIGERWDNVNKLYDCVRKTLDESIITSWGQKIIVGMIPFSHSYGSIDMDWKPHLNVIISGLGFVEFKGKFLKEYYRISRGRKLNITKVKGKKYIRVSSKFIDYSLTNQNYKNHLEKTFNTKLKYNPQVRWDNTISDKSDMAIFKTKNDNGVPIKEIINKLTSYFKRIPIKTDNICWHNKKTVTFTTHKRKQLKLDPITLPIIDFYKRIIQHISPSDFRNMRLWGLYQYNHRLGNSYYVLKEKNKDPFKPKCSICDGDMDICFVSSYGIIVYLENTNNFNYKDFSLPLELYEPIPDELKPPDKIPYIHELYQNDF